MIRESERGDKIKKKEQDITDNEDKRRNKGE